MSKRVGLFYLLVLTSLAAYVLLLYFTPRSNFPQLIGLYTFLFAAYAGLMATTNPETPLHRLLTAAFLFRLALLFAWPNLSDDYFRFVWDGRLLTHGINPYLVLPSQFIQTPEAASAGLTRELFTHLNSPHYYTVYPPVHQAIFAAAARLFPQSVWGSLIVMRFFLLLAEAGTVYLLIKLSKQFRLPNTRVLLYALNPLVIVELTGNLHFEALMIFLCLGALYGFCQHPMQRFWLLFLSGLSLALSIGVKLIPLMFLPSLWKKLGFKRGFVYCAWVGLLLLVMFAPFVSRDLVHHFTSSVDLYFQKFEFNASVYYLVREIGYWLKGYNIIGTAGPYLSGVALLGILAIAFSPRPFWKPMAGSGSKAPLLVSALFSLTIYYALATTVHPWYLATLVALSVLTPYRFPLVWSALVPLTYFTYRTSDYRENGWLVAVEYVLVFGWMFYEIVKKPSAQKTPIQ